MSCNYTILSRKLNQMFELGTKSTGMTGSREVWAGSRHPWPIWKWLVENEKYFSNKYQGRKNENLSPCTYNIISHFAACLVAEFWQNPNFYKWGDKYLSWQGWQSTILLRHGRTISAKETNHSVPYLQNVNMFRQHKGCPPISWLSMCLTWFMILRSVAKCNF